MAVSLQKIIAHSKEYGFIFPSSEIYDGVQAVYDYGPLGVELRNHLKHLWWTTMTRYHEDIVGIDSAIFMHPSIWKASGHVDHFSDPMIDNKDSKKRYRVSFLLEDKIAEYTAKNQLEKADALQKAMATAFERDDLAALYDLIQNEDIVCPLANSKQWTPVRHFNLMFETQVGALEAESQTLYLRPETAQGIFVNFINVQKSVRKQIPFGIAQIGKAFRNEIVARQFTFRMREFEQMEMQFFVPPGKELDWFAHWKNERMRWHKKLLNNSQKLQFHDHDHLAHYANAATDIEFEFPFGFKEVEGIHSRTDFDLSQHQKFSKKKQSIFDPNLKKSYIPFVIETSVGLDRLTLMVLCNSYLEEKVGEKKRTYLRLPNILAPVKFAVLPLVKKDGVPEKAKAFYKKMRLKYNIVYEEQATIGKRYTRQDLIGTPYCITFDYNTLEKDIVTIRWRDDTRQIKMHLSEIENWLDKNLSLVQWLND